MKISTRIVIATLTLVASADLANAQDEPGGPPPGGRPPRPAPPVITALDANHDHEIDATEIANAPAALKTLDKNGDGKLTPDELRPQFKPRGPGGPGGPEGEGAPPPPPPPHGEGGPGSEGKGGPTGGHRPPAPPLINALDANHDGAIDATELANASAELKTLDKNGDGVLTPDEIRPPHMGGPKGPGGPGGHGPDSPPPPPPPAE